VNVAARLESANKQLGTRICVSETVVDQMADFKGRSAGILLLKGKSRPLQAFEPLSNEQTLSPAIVAYREASARQAFATLVGQYDHDPLATFHLQRLLAGESGVDIELTEK
jgi:adenylate cyclase